jgi:N-acyl-D-amino-acid deacylase
MGPLDVLIKNGTVADGTGKAPRRADVGIVGDRIAFVGRAGDLNARQTIEATHRIVAPGFIDVHAHSDYLLLIDRHADNRTLQGITTEIGGNCGLSAGPFADLWYVDWWIDSPRNFYSVPWDEGVRLVAEHGLTLDWTTLGGFLERLDAGGLAVNYGSLVGHYVLRSTAYGEPHTQPIRRPTAKELERMAGMVGAALEEGAFGLSVGFQHTDPELDVELDEVVRLCKVVAARDGLFTIHLPSYGDRLITAVRDAITISERTGVRMSISHLWADGKENWGKARSALDLIEDARVRGLPVYTDVLLTLQARNYMSGDLKTMLPDDVVDYAGGRWAAYLADSRRATELAHRIRRGGLANRWYKARFYPTSYWPLWETMLRVVHCGMTKQFEGMMLAEVAREMECDASEALVQLLRLNDGQANTVLERSSERDIVDVLQYPAAMVGSDGNPLRPLKSPRAPNPRVYGTFPRLFGRFVRELRALSLEAAVVKCTSLPAEFLGLRDRGELRPGYLADVVIFDPAAIRDCPNLIGPPDRYAEGIDEVLVAGTRVVANGRLTDALPGRVIRRNSD